MSQPSRHMFMVGMLVLTMLVGASLACSRDNRQSSTDPTVNPPAAQAPAAQPPQATSLPTDQPQSEPTRQSEEPSAIPPTQVPTLATPTATEGPSESDVLATQVDDMLNQLEAANNSADDLSDANP